ncbi:ATP-binding protein [Eisenibacter elegans]|jgi:DNA polymerase-3 subunit delta'|uniref:DNA polymerase III subunit n=1 Tax=Eisenibacter elegans TaxID=997 RepID=UPI000419F323|nr:hypothetical protein [Eisenibacter elegans]
MRFSDIVGLDTVKEQLLQAYHRGQIAHAQLFYGQEGGAALPIAWAYASLLLCQQPDATGACGVCPSCVKSGKLIHPDLHFVFPTANTANVSKATSLDFLAEWRSALLDTPYLDLSQWLHLIEADNKQASIAVEESRRLVNSLALKPFEANYKVLLMWLPEWMNLNAANAILKILEEPPSRTIFLLVSYQPDKLLATIRSRVQALQIPAFSDEELRQNLLAHYPIDEARAQAIGYLADGSMSEAHRLLQSEAMEHLPFFRDWMRACYKSDVLEMLSFMEVFGKMGKETQKNLIRYGMGACRDALLSGQALGSLVRLEGEAVQFIQGLGKVMHLENTPGIYEALNTAYGHLERNANGKILFLNLSIQLARLLKQTGSYAQ